MKDLVNQLNKAFESRVRLGIMSALMVNDRLSFNRLKELLGVTDGNLSSHLRALENLEYIIMEKQFVERKSHTNYRLSDAGRAAFKSHLNTLEALLKNN